MDKLTKVVHALLKIARPEIRKDFASDSCIASTRIGMEVLDYFCILSEPLPVRAAVWNPAFVKLIDSGKQAPKNGPELDAWVKEYGAWNVGLGMGANQEGKWPGHLVLLVEKKILVDLSIDQASRPQHNINLTPLAGEITPEMAQGKERFHVKLNDCVICYEANVNNLGYKKSPNWYVKSQWSRAVGEIIRQIKEELK